jgi:hypothetical protein
MEVKPLGARLEALGSCDLVKIVAVIQWGLKSLKNYPVHHEEAHLDAQSTSDMEKGLYYRSHPA